MSQGNFNALKHELSEVQERLRRASGRWRRRRSKNATSVGAWEAARSQSPGSEEQPFPLGRFVEDSRRELSAFRKTHPKTPSFGRRAPPSNERPAARVKRRERQTLMNSTMSLLESILRAPSTDSSCSSPQRQVKSPARSRNSSQDRSLSMDTQARLSKQRRMDAHKQLDPYFIAGRVDRDTSFSPLGASSKLTVGTPARASDIAMDPSWNSTTMMTPELQMYGSRQAMKHSPEILPKSQLSSECHSTNASNEFHGRMPQSSLEVEADALSSSKSHPSPPPPTRLSRPSSAPPLRRSAEEMRSTFSSTRPEEMNESLSWSASGETGSHAYRDSNRERGRPWQQRCSLEDLELPTFSRSLKTTDGLTEQHHRSHSVGHLIGSSSDTPGLFSPLPRSRDSTIRRNASDMGRLLKRSPSRQYVLSLERELAQLRNENTYLRMSLLAEPSVQRPRRQRRASSSSVSTGRHARAMASHAHRSSSRPLLSRPAVWH